MAYLLTLLIFVVFCEAQIRHDDSCYQKHLLYIEEGLNAIISFIQRDVMLMVDDFKDDRLNYISLWESQPIIIKQLFSHEIINEDYKANIAGDDINVEQQPYSRPMTVIMIISNSSVFQFFKNDPINHRSRVRNIYIFFLPADYGLTDLKRISFSKDFNLIFLNLVCRKDSANFKIIIQSTIRDFAKNLQDILNRKIENINSKENRNVTITWKIKQESVHGQSLRVPVFDDNMALQIEALSNTSAVKIVGGFRKGAVDILQEKFNLRMHFYRPNETFPSRKQNGSWLGFLGLFHRQEGDINFNDIVITEDRLDAVEFTRPFSVDPLPITSKIPGFRPKTFLVFKSFQLLTWLTIILYIIALAIVIYTIHSLRNRSNKNLIFWIWYLLKLLFLQESNVRRFPSPLPFLLLLWSIVSLVLTSAYQGLIFRQMAFPQNKEPINTVAQLESSLKDGSAEFICTEYNFIFKYLEESPSRRLKHIWNLIASKKHLLIFQNDSDALKNLKENRVTVLDRREVLLSLSKQIKVSDLHFSRDPIAVVVTGIILRPGFPYRKEIDETVRSIVESGLFEKWKMQDVDLGLLSKQKSVYPFVHLTDIQGAFLIYLLGSLISAFVFFWEYCQDLSN